MSGFCYTGFSSPDNVANGTRRPKSRPTEPEVQKETQHSGKSGGFSNVSEGFGRSFGHNSPYGFETARYSHFSSRVNQNAAVQSTGARGFGSRLFGEKSEQHVGLRELKNRNRISNGFGKVESDDMYDPSGTLETQSDRSSAGSRGRTRPRQLGSSRTSGSTDVTIESVGTVTGALRFLHLSAATEKSPCNSTGFGHNSNEEVGVLGLTTNCFVESRDPLSVHSYLLDRCFKCRESVTDWGKGYHPAECKDALQGFMTWNFETTKTKFYCEKKFSNYQTLSAAEVRKFYKILGKLTPGTEDKFEEEFGNILRTIEGFGNMGGRSLVVAYDLFWRKLSVTEAFEFKLHDLRIEQVRIPVDGDKNFRGYELSFSTGSPGGFGEPVMEVAALRRKLKCNGVYGFPIFICIREDYHSVQWHNADASWPDDIPRKTISKN
ncbi:unnamed protein product [Bursaphelenchus xylophilus]|uniref:(pine wood nematode) hypothetical protein n=1 Tax=Bursaphelenchus xylophilus TaxID=6326 RepID=A0A7I8XGE0_BURXY|nr:unnamed protein product [Bursaphelenchus xylophilus]CAG9081521.1 unnamed protein product [Bursaphelenchus xylophilus]